MQLVKSINLIPESFFAETDSQVLDLATYTDINKLTEVYVNPDRSLYLFKDETKLVGFVDAEFKPSIVNIKYAIKENLRGKGYGKQMLQQFLKLPEVEGRAVETMVTESTATSIKLLKDLGFTEAGKNADGLLRFMM